MFIKKKLILILSLVISSCFAARQYMVNHDSGFGKEPQLRIKVLSEDRTPLENVQLTLKRNTIWEDKKAEFFMRHETSKPEKFSFSKEISLKYDFAESWDLVIDSPGYYSEFINFPEIFGKNLIWEDKGKFQETCLSIMLVRTSGETELYCKEGLLRLEKEPKETRFFYLKILEDRKVTYNPRGFQSGPYLSVASTIPSENYAQYWKPEKSKQLPKTILLRLNDGEKGNGFIPVPDDELIRNVHPLVTAPESGYKSEIPLPVGDKKTFLYFKLGQYYGKAFAASVYNQYGRLEAVIRMFFNPIPGNRNLRSLQIN